MKKYDEKYTKCPACQNENIIHYHDDFRGNSIYKCNSCQVQFMNPVYSDEYLVDYYSRYIDLEQKNNLEQNNDFVLTDKYIHVVADNFKALETVVKSKGEMLDFGIGNGVHAEMARDKGWTVRGYDVDCSTTEALMKKTGIEVKCGNFFDIDWGDKKFDLIYANQVMEHLKDPVSYINHFDKLLNKNGHLFITVPNIHSTSSRLKFWLEKMKLRNKNIGKYYDSEHHIFYYTPTSLRNILRSNGYEVLYTRNCVKPKVESSKLWLFVSNKILEKLYSTSTFVMIAKKI